MTTNVYDIRAGMLASDSRISTQEDRFTFFADNIGYEKIVFDPYYAILFAGDIDKIDPWKTWFLGGRNGEPPEETDEHLSICLVDLITGEADLDRGRKWDSPCNQARFAGTGGYWAKKCWVENEDPLRCIETAYGRDLRSGGPVKYYDRTKNSSNIEHKLSMHQIIDVMAEQGGVIMPDVLTKTILPIKDAIKEDSAVNDAFNKVKSGGAASLCMPFAGMGKPWTSEERNKLYSSLKKYPPITQK